jgi:putative ABC transport system ATP-binding protein
MGPSGFGKTTLLNVISTIDRPTSGSVLIEGQDITTLREPLLSDFRRNRLGFLFQDFNLLDTMTLQENIVLPLALSRVAHGVIMEKLREISTSLGIDDVLGKRPYEVSGGQKQRAAAARAIITSPALVLADEPTGALDSKSARELMACLGRLNEQNNATILIVTHDAFTASYCRRIVFIKDGMLFNELYRGDVPRKNFYQSILQVLSVMGGGNGDAL